MIVVYVSNHSYTRKYDIDMLKELHATEGRGPIVVISEVDYPEVADVSDYQFVLSNQDTTRLDPTYESAQTAMSFTKGISLNLL